MNVGRVAAFRPDNPELGLEVPRRRTTGRPRLVVVVDTEEEFDWSAPFSRDARSVTAIRHLHDAQRVFDRYGVKPTYVIDHPVATDRDGFQPLKELLDSGCCSIGAHLHPWVNPPFDEEVTARNSFACNLGEELEEAKLRVLRDAIQDKLAIEPVVYKAGRYGIGVTTTRILRRLGFQIDTSVNPHMDFTSQGGPDFTGFPEEPFRFDSSLVEVPCTTGYDGMLWTQGARLHALASRPSLQGFRLTGVFSRLRLANRINLSPETSTLPEMMRLTRAMLQRGLRTFTFSFHSPSVHAGHTPYVRTAADVSAFMARIEGYLDFFVGVLDGRGATLQEVRMDVLQGLEDAAT